jgi:hypothetical protein
VAGVTGGRGEVNHSDGERKVHLAAPGYDLIGERLVDGTLALDQQGVAILRRDTTPRSES